MLWAICVFTTAQYRFSICSGFAVSLSLFTLLISDRFPVHTDSPSRSTRDAPIFSHSEGRLEKTNDLTFETIKGRSYKVMRNHSYYILTSCFHLCFFVILLWIHLQTQRVWPNVACSRICQSHCFPFCFHYPLSYVCGQNRRPSIHALKWEAGRANTHLLPRCLRHHSWFSV